jgi:hypothetical protein
VWVESSASTTSESDGGKNPKYLISLGSYLVLVETEAVILTPYTEDVE